MTALILYHGHAGLFGFGAFAVCFTAFMAIIVVFKVGK